MTPEFARAVDPIFLACLQFVSRIENQERLVAADERAALLHKIDDAEVRLGATPEWQLAKYALCAWADSLLINAQWNGAAWWKDNCLEVRYFGRRDAHEEFYKKGLEAGELGRKDALEVYYLSVVLGFRGFYGDSDATYAANLARSMRLPANIESWCRGVARSLQLRQGRPQIPEIVTAGGSAKPLGGKSALISYSMISVLLLAVAISCFVVLFVLTGQP